MLQTLKNAFKNKEIRTKILITLALLFAYRLGCWIPLPGLNTEVAWQGISMIGGQDNTLWTLLSAIGGQALQQGALLAIGISPYINASIIVQLLTVAIPYLEKQSKLGEDGKRRIANITRFVTLGLAIAQAVGIVISWYNVFDTETGMYAVKAIFGGVDRAWTATIMGVILVAGAMFTMWLGELITELGVGNGMSLLIFVGIIASAGLALVAQIQAIVTSTGDDQLRLIWVLIIFFVALLFIFLFIIWIDLAERKIPVSYAKQVKGRKQYGGQSTHIPIKVNANGVLPIIFSTALLTFPQVIFQLILGGRQEGGFFDFYQGWMKWVGTSSWIYFVLMGLLILFFSYFYNQIQFKPDEVARNLQQYGGTLTGIRPGKPTADYLGRVSKRLTLFGAIFLAIIAIVPSLIFQQVPLFNNPADPFSKNLVNAFTATGMLIAVSVALELQKQLESLIMMKHYKGFLK
ncbi:MAG: preprotein translocase subunit SecY [Firmicutes bacterium]|nr:preprotein translocase subunit SecY [Bacillota bacterium]